MELKTAQCRLREVPSSDQRFKNDSMSASLFHLLTWMTFSAPEASSKSEVKRASKSARRCQLSVSKEDREPFRHVGVSISFNDRIEFVVSRRIVDGSFYPLVFLFGAEALTCIERIPEENVRHLHLKPIWETRNRKRAEAMIDAILYDEESWFTIWERNCRDHVRKTFLKAMANEQWRLMSQEEFDHLFKEIHCGDVFRCFIIFCFALSWIIFLWCDALNCFMVTEILIQNLKRQHQTIAAFSISFISMTSSPISRGKTIEIGQFDVNLLFGYRDVTVRLQHLIDEEFNRHRTFSFLFGSCLVITWNKPTMQLRYILQILHLSDNAKFIDLANLCSVNFYYTVELFSVKCEYNRLRETIQ